MKQVYNFILIFFCIPAFSSSLQELETDSKVIESSLNFKSSSLSVVQKRLLPKKYLSEFSLGLSPVIKGFNYMDSYSTDVSYRFFLSSHWSAHLKYSWYSNPINNDGEDEVLKRFKIPVELKYPIKQSYFAGADWMPFYGKALLYNKLVRFDIYISASLGLFELLNLDKKIPGGSIAVGAAMWRHQRFNARLEFQGMYYKYHFMNDNKKETAEEYLYKIALSAGFLL